MVVPGSAPLIQQDHALEPALGRDSSHGSAMGPDTEPAPGQVGPELEEVRKLRELVRRLELENQHPRTKGGRSVLGTKAGGESRDPALSGTDIHNSINALADARGLQIVADLHHQLSQMRKEGGDNGCLPKGGDAQVQHGCSGAPEEPPPCPRPAQGSGAPRNGPGLPGSWVPGDIDPTGKRQHPDAAGSSGEVAVLPDNADLDEVKVLELESCLEDDDSWLYVSPRKSVDQKPASPLSWCRQVLDNPSPETEAACRTLITRLDQASRWKNLYCSPLASPSAHNLSTEPGSSSNALNSPGHLKSTNKALLTCGSSGFLAVHSALSSQSSVDSELSTSDDSISMGYKLQDLTDVQVMARLQEESLRQDCASSSASVSRRSSSASLHSLRRGTYSDQEFDSYSLEDEEDGDCSLSYRSAHRYSPSPLSSPRCQSPSSCTDHGRGSASRIRPPRRSVQSPLQDRLKYASSEEEMRHSMPNLARTGPRSLESVRSSRSLESDLQVPSSRIPRTQQRSAGLAPSKLRYSSGAGQSPLTVRQPLKGGSCPTPLLPPRQAVKAGSYAAPGGGARKAQGSSLGSGSSGGSCTARGTSVGTVAKNSPLKPRTAVGGLSVPRNKPATPSRRFLQSAQPPEDDSWKEGCY